MKYYPTNVLDDVYADPSEHLAAWRACRLDELYSDPKALAEAVEDWLPGGSQEALAGLLAALSGLEPGALPMDNVVLQHAAAIRVHESLVNQVVAAQERMGVWREWDWGTE
jgi:hypothetical protein